jgi:hypothetical protein
VFGAAAIESEVVKLQRGLVRERNVSLRVPKEIVTEGDDVKVMEGTVK